MAGEFRITLSSSPLGIVSFGIFCWSLGWDSGVWATSLMHRHSSLFYIEETGLRSSLPVVDISTTRGIRDFTASRYIFLFAMESRSDPPHSVESSSYNILLHQSYFRSRNNRTLRLKNPGRVWKTFAWYAQTSGLEWNYANGHFL